MFHKMKNNTIIILCAIICLTLIICGVLFWPTLYRYDILITKEKQYNVRINRVTGYTEVLYSSGWGELIKENNIELISPNDLKLIKQNGQVIDGYYESDVYNGTDYIIKKIRIIFIIYDYDGNYMNTSKILENNVSIAPYSVGLLSIRLRHREIGPKGEGLSEEELVKIAKLKFEVKIDKAFGYKAE